MRHHHSGQQAAITHEDEATPTNQGQSRSGPSAGVTSAVRSRAPRRPLGWLRRELRVWRAEVRRPRQRYVGWETGADGLPRYPIDMEPFLAVPHGILDAHGVPLNTIHGVPGGVHQPTTIAQYGLAHWNAYLRTRDPQHRDAFLVQAGWLVEHEQVLVNGAGVWPIPFPQPSYGATGPWLSALTQGNVISVLVRAYQLTGDEIYLAAARRGARAFALDILDGGVNAPVGREGIFFEEVATYPAAHILNGYLLALFGLYDFVRLTGDDELRAIADRSVATLHELIDEYDAGYWTRYDLLHRQLALRSYHALHISLLEALADYTGCAHCGALATKWRAYEISRWCRLRYFIASRVRRYVTGLSRRLKPWRRHGAAVMWPWRVLVPRISGEGGSDADRVATMRRAMAGEWQIEELAVRGGKRTLARRLRQQRVDVVLQLGGAVAAPFAAPPARRAGVPLVVMDDGPVVSSRAAVFRAILRPRIRRGVRGAEHLLLAGDEVERAYRERLGVPLSQVVRVPPLVVEHSVPPEMREAQRGKARERLRLDPHRVLVAVSGATAGQDELEHALAALDAVRGRIAPGTAAAGTMPYLLIVGCGPLRSWLEAEVEQRSLGNLCMLWDESVADEVPVLLRAADIFLYSGRRDTSDSLAVLEAMAAGCAVVVTAATDWHRRLLAGGRGLAVDGDDVGALSSALEALLNDANLPSRMGTLAQQYVVAEYSVEALRRALRRGTGWAPAVEELRSSVAPHAMSSGERNAQEIVVSIGHEEQ